MTGMGADVVRLVRPNLPAPRFSVNASVARPVDPRLHTFAEVLDSWR